MKVLVTGATGFLGSHLVSALIKEGFEVVALIRSTSDANMAASLGCQTVTGDLLDLASLSRSFKGLDGVFHVAGAMSSSPKEKERLLKVNIDGVRNVIAACKDQNVKKLIHVSSVVAVGVNLTANEALLTEESANITKGMAYTNYDSKRIGEELVLEAAKKGEIQAIVVNPGLIYGAGDARKIIRKGNVMAAKGKLPVYPSGGVNIVAVEDVTAAMIEAFHHGRNGERYLLTGDNITIKDLLSKISLYAGAKAPSKKMPERFLKFLATVFDSLGLKSEVCRENIFSATSFHWYDSAKAKRELGFKPRSHDEAISSSVEWMKKNNYL